MFAESLVISRSRKAFHGVMFHPQQLGVLVSANARDGVALWDLRSTKKLVIFFIQFMLFPKYSKVGRENLLLR